MHFKFIRSPGAAVDTMRTQNVGYDHGQVMRALSQLVEQGHTLELLEGADLSDEQLAELKSDARAAFQFPPHKRKGRKLGNAFGTNSQPWQDFGTGIPVLLVYDDGRCVDTYPHNEADRLITIMEYLAPGS